MRCSYKEDDVTVLLKDITGLVRPLGSEERENLVQSGMHYSEMLPIEYVPTEEYMNVYEETLSRSADCVAEAVGKLAYKIVKKRNRKPVLVSLARAGMPIGILLKRYIKQAFNIDAPHYAISIIRGRGIDTNAMQYILQKHKPEQLVFVDGWIGKGAIARELESAISAYEGVSSELAALSDPANITNLYGTREDILIPSSCLNATVSGLLSRTFLRSDVIGPKDFHGAVYYEELKNSDLSEAFLTKIEEKFPTVMTHLELNESIEDTFDVSVLEDVRGLEFSTGLEEVESIAKTYNVKDVNLIKPGIGETTRVLLRRVPWKILIDKRYKHASDLKHIIRLSEERNVPICYVSLEHYKCCGVIKKLNDV